LNKKQKGGKWIMSKKSLILLVVAAFVMSLGFGVTMSLAEADKGDADITINADSKSEKPKPAQFTHAKHQERNPDCATCHHTEDGGKQVPSAEVSTDGTAKCDSCHNADFANEKLRKWKDIGHGLCKNCHKKMKEDGAPTKCGACHPKKK
jgi:predicted CXXCH cytochrome family protein